MTRQHLAIDIGASSGRGMIGELVDGKMQLTEVYRFSNGLTQKNHHLCWDIGRLRLEVLQCFIACKNQGYHPETVGIDTWAVDYVLLDDKNQLLTDVISYRDARTDGIRDELEEKGILSFQEHYQKTGIQYQKFNTCYQLYAFAKEQNQLLQQAAKFLMIPDYLNLYLCGVATNEYTNATTTGLVNCETDFWDLELIQKLGIPASIFQPIRKPGSALGHLTKEIQEIIGFDCQVILTATHDTGSAFLAIPSTKENTIILSSGTWSLCGVEIPRAIRTQESLAANFTNEGGYQNRFRFLKNCMGLWMIQSVRKEMGRRLGTLPTFPECIAMAKNANTYVGTIDVNHPRFLAPQNMMLEIQKECQEEHQPIPHSDGEILQCIYQSLVKDYATSVKQLESCTKQTYQSMNIIGGGSQDAFLNQMTANAINKTVYAGPTEGTAIGNLIVQWIYTEELRSLQEARLAVLQSFDIKEYHPEGSNL